MKEKKKIPWSTLYLAATIIAIVIFGFANNQFGNAFTTITSLSPIFVLISVAVLVVFFLFEGGIIRYLLNSQGEKIGFAKAIKIGLIGIYYSYITPSSTGGQPAQVAYLKRDDNVSVGSSVAALFVKFFTYQAAFVITTLAAFGIMWNQIVATNAVLIPFIWLGIAMNSLWLVFIPMLFTRTILNKLAAFVVKLINKFKFIKRKEKYIGAVEKFRVDFTDYSHRFRQKKGAVLISILLSFIQVILQMCILFFVFLAFGYRNFSFVEITAMQTLLQSTVCFMPMPGASGAQEIAFSTFFGGYFTNNDLFTAVMVWRFLTYYIVVIGGAGLVVVDELIHRKKRREWLAKL